MAGGKIGVLLDSGEMLERDESATVMVAITFEVADNAPIGFTPLTFGDSLIWRGISNPSAESLTADYVNGGLIIVGRVSAADGR